jgi:hypothetical protein
MTVNCENTIDASNQQRQGSQKKRNSLNELIAKPDQNQKNRIVKFTRSMSSIPEARFNNHLKVDTHGFNAIGDISTESMLKQ